MFVFPVTIFMVYVLTFDHDYSSKVESMLSVRCLNLPPLLIVGYIACVYIYFNPLLPVGKDSALLLAVSHSHSQFDNRAHVFVTSVIAMFIVHT